MKDAMNDVDDELRHALRREEPPTGFSARVLRRVAEQTQDPRSVGAAFSRTDPAEHGPIRLKPDPTANRDSSNRGRLPFVRWAAAAALVAAVAGGFDYVAKQEERAEGEAARERVVLALHIAGSKLQLVQTKISRIHESPEKNSNQPPPPGYGGPPKPGEGG